MVGRPASTNFEWNSLNRQAQEWQNAKIQNSEKQICPKDKKNKKNKQQFEYAKQTN